MTTDGADPIPQAAMSSSDLSGGLPYSGPCTVHHIDTAEGRETWREMLAVAPHLQTMVNYITNKQAVPSERTLRWYQRELFENWFFRIPSPFTAQMIRSGDSYTVHERKTVFRFPSEPGVMLASANLGDGFPINTILMPALGDGQGRGLTFGPRVWTITTEEATEALATFAKPEWQTNAPAREATAICGDPNYAHFIWNQLPALREASRLPRHDPPASLFTFFEPAGDVEQLLPELRQWPINRAPHYVMPNAPGRVAFCFGSSQIDAGTRALLRDTADAAVTDDVRAIISRIDTHRPVVWVSVRTRNRTATNQTEFLTAVCGTILSKWPDSIILMDGHSFAEDDHRHPLDDSKNSIARDKVEIAAIIGAVSGALPHAADRMIDISGLSVLNSIALADHADFYVCHHGSVQHKIGWTTTVPGVVHSNRRVIDLHPAHWVASQAGHDVLPVYFPGALIEDTPDSVVPEDEEASSLLNENYHFVDLEAATGFVVKQLAVHHMYDTVALPAADSPADDLSAPLTVSPETSVAPVPDATNADSPASETAESGTPEETPTFAGDDPDPPSHLSLLTRLINVFRP